MVAREHSRAEIWGAAQHPYKHSISEFYYSNPAFGGEVTNLEGALNWIMAVLYPQDKGSVANKAALPASGNTINDYMVVLDNGGGTPAGYRWEQREGESSPSWHQIYDFNWSTDGVISAYLNKTQDQYVSKYGRDDRDGSGNVLTGDLAGQHFYGGASAGTHLTLHSNNGDGANPVTGYVQVASNFRPESDNAWTSGTATYRWKQLFTVLATVGTMSLAGGSITDTSGAITFGSAALSTTGNVQSNKVTTTLASVFGTMTVGAGSITDSGGAISFGSNVLTTTGHVAAGTLSLAGGSITDSSGAISFGTAALSTSGNISSSGGTVSGATVTGTTLNGGNLQVSGNAITAQNANGGITLTPNGLGTVTISSALSSGTHTVTGNISATGTISAGNLLLSGDTLSTTDLNGNLILAPNGTGAISLAGNAQPSADASKTLGTAALRFTNLFLSGGIGDGTNTVGISALMSLRGILTGVQTGYGLFWNGSQFVAADPDSEIFHDAISHLTLGDAGHTQFAMLAGRTGGQTIYGDTAASGNLILGSTSNATKGAILLSDPTKPVTDAATDLGDATHRFQNLYLSGQGIGFRVENAVNVAGLPAASAANKGRLAFDTTLSDLYVDTGGSWKKAGVDPYRYQDATGWTGSTTTVTYDVSSRFTDARLCLWGLQDNSNNCKQILCDIDFPTATQVRVTVDMALAAGTYSLVGVG